MAMACLVLPPEVMITWTIINLGLLCLGMRYFRSRNSGVDDKTLRTFYEGEWGMKSKTEELTKPMSRSKKVIVQKESYELTTVQVKKERSQEEDRSECCKSKVIYFLESEGSDDGGPVTVTSRHLGKIAFEDFCIRCSPLISVNGWRLRRRRIG